MLAVLYLPRHDDQSDLVSYNFVIVQFGGGTKEGDLLDGVCLALSMRGDMSNVCTQYKYFCQFRLDTAQHHFMPVSLPRPGYVQQEKYKNTSFPLVK